MRIGASVANNHGATRLGFALLLEFFESEALCGLGHGPKQRASPTIVGGFRVSQRLTSVRQELKYREYATGDGLHVVPEFVAKPRGRRRPRLRGVLVAGPLTQAERTARTRAELLRVAQQRFFRDGYHGTSMDDVARDAGYTRGAVYATFESKAGLFLALCELVFQQRLDLVRAMAAPDTAERLDALARQPVDPRNEAWLLLCIEFWVHSARQPKLLAAFTEIYRGVRVGLIELAPADPGPLGAEDWAIVTLALANGLALERLVDPDGVPEDLMARTLRLLMAHPSPLPSDVVHEQQEEPS